MQVEELLEAVKNGTLSIKEAKAKLARAPFEDLGFAKLDTHRALRSGFPEVVFCQNKDDHFLVSISKNFMKPTVRFWALEPVNINMNFLSNPYRFNMIR